MAAPRAKASSTPIVATKPAMKGLCLSKGWPNRRTVRWRARSSAAPPRAGSSVEITRSSSSVVVRSRGLAGLSAINHKPFNHDRTLPTGGQWPWSAPTTDKVSCSSPARAEVSSVQPPGPGLTHDWLAPEPWTDQYGDQRNRRTLRPGREVSIVTDRGVSDRIRAGPLARPGLPATRQSCQ